MDQNAYPSPFPTVPTKYDDNGDDDQGHHPFIPNIRASSSSSSCISFHTIQDRTGLHEQQLRPLLHHQDHNYAYNGGSSTTYEVKWRKEDPGDVPLEMQWRNDDANPVKLMSSKTRLKRKMKKNHDGLGLNLTSYCTPKKSSYLGTDSSNNNSSRDDIPIRVCSDCNTIKTPLWRSGPKGPKSLCNACGIKQRKARRAAAAAVQPQELKEKATGKNPQASLLMKWSEMERTAANIAPGSKSNGQKKLSFEDFLKKLSQKCLTFHPEDEKDAAILLMALSYGLLHG